MGYSGARRAPERLRWPTVPSTSLPQQCLYFLPLPQGQGALRDGRLRAIERSPTGSRVQPQSAAGRARSYYIMPPPRGLAGRPAAACLEGEAGSQITRLAHPSGPGGPAVFGGGRGRLAAAAETRSRWSADVGGPGLRCDRKAPALETALEVCDP